MKKIFSLTLGLFTFFTLGINSVSADVDTTVVENKVETAIEIQPYITIDYFKVDRDTYAGEYIWHEGWSGGKYYRGYLPYTGRTGWLGLTGKYRYEGRLNVAPIAPNSIETTFFQ